MQTQTQTPAATPVPTPAVSFETPDLTQAEFRALRAGQTVTREAAVQPSAVTDAPAVAADDNTENAGATEEPEPNSEETDEQEPAKPAKGKKDGVSGRISELTAKIRTLETQLSQKGNGPTETKPAAAAAPPPAADDPEPIAEKFGSYLDWQKAYIKWELRQEQRAQETTRIQNEQRAAAATRAESWQTRVTKASGEMTDFAEVAQNPDLPVTREMGEAIVESEIGPKILYHLGKNPDEAARIAKLSPVAQVREIGKLEAKLEAAAAPPANSATSQPKTQTVSKAPAPHKPVGGSAVSANPAKGIESMTQAEYRALRESGRLR